VLSWLICYWAFGLNWSSLQYTDHAWSPRDVREGAWNLRFWRITQAIFLNYISTSRIIASPTIPWTQLPGRVRPEDPNPSFWSIYGFAVGRRPSGARGSTTIARAGAAIMSGRPLSFPTWARLWTGILGALVVSLAFFPIYVGGSMTTGVLGQRLHLYAAFELALPFWPAMIIAYLSMFALFLLPTFQLDESELWVLVRRLVAASILGGLVFLSCPPRSALPSTPTPVAGSRFTIWSTASTAAPMRRRRSMSSIQHHPARAHGCGHASCAFSTYSGSSSSALRPCSLTGITCSMSPAASPSRLRHGDCVCDAPQRPHTVLMPWSGPMKSIASAVALFCSPSQPRSRQAGRRRLITPRCAAQGRCSHRHQ